jgi:hypothetical protein
MWTYILGPFLALLPKDWRNSLPFHNHVDWARAISISGFLEFFAAIICLGYWYVSSMSYMVDHAVGKAGIGELGNQVTDHAISGAALFIWATQPLTLVLGYFMVEGAVRFCGAAFAETNLGSLPFFLVDKVLFKPFRREARAQDFAGPGAVSNIASYAGAISEHVRTAGLFKSEDELRVRKEGVDEFLEIYTWQRKMDWTPPRVVRVDQTYYRLENCARGTAARPFCYVLRRLAAGVPSRTVLLYAPPETFSHK